MNLYDDIYTNWLNGNRMDAAQAIRELNKAQLVDMCFHHVPNADFKIFIIRVMEGAYNERF